MHGCTVVPRFTPRVRRRFCKTVVRSYSVYQAKKLGVESPSRLKFRSIVRCFLQTQSLFSLALEPRFQRHRAFHPHNGYIESPGFNLRCREREKHQAWKQISSASFRATLQGTNPFSSSKHAHPTKSIEAVNVLSGYALDCFLKASH